MALEGGEGPRKAPAIPSPSRLFSPLQREEPVICPTRQRAEQAHHEVGAILAPLGLHLHPDKTRIVHLANGADGFDFLGFHHRTRKSHKSTGRYWLHKWPSPRAMATIKAKVRARTPRWRASWPLDDVVADLNPVLRGWGAYFRYGNSAGKFAAIDAYTHQRLARLASIKHGKTGLNWTTRFSYRWFNELGIHRLSGTVRYWPTHAPR